MMIQQRNRCKERGLSSLSCGSRFTMKASVKKVQLITVKILDIGQQHRHSLRKSSRRTTKEREHANTQADIMTIYLTAFGCDIRVLKEKCGIAGLTLLHFTLKAARLGLVEKVMHWPRAWRVSLLQAVTRGRVASLDASLTPV